MTDELEVAIAGTCALCILALFLGAIKEVEKVDPPPCIISDWIEADCFGGPCQVYAECIPNESDVERSSDGASPVLTIPNIRPVVLPGEPDAKQTNPPKPRTDF